MIFSDFLSSYACNKKQIMKKYFLLLLLFACSTQITTAQINAGVGTVYRIDDSIFGVQARGVINASESWRIGGAFSYFLGDKADYSVDADVQYELLTIADNVNLFPMAGINFSDYGADTDIGINIGLFSDFRINDGVHLFIEPKYLISDASGLIISAGVLF